MPEQLGLTPWLLLTMKRTRGFTLLELMVVLTIIGIIMAVGLPSLFLWLANVRVRTGADGLQNGIRLAQVEAVRRNDNVMLKLTSDIAPSTANPNVSASGTNWVLTDSTGSNLIQAKGNENATGLTQTASAMSGSGSIFKTTTGVITFNPLGGNDLLQSAKFAYSSTAADHSMAVALTPDGRVRLCDPSISTAGDSRNCQ